MGAGGGPSGRNIPESEIQNTLNGGEDFTIGENDTTVFSDDFEIPQGRTLTNNGTIDLADATVDITGNFINNGTVTNNFTLINLLESAVFKNNGIFEIDGNVNVDSKIAEFNSSGTFQANTFKILDTDEGTGTSVVQLNLFNEDKPDDPTTFTVTTFENKLTGLGLSINGGDLRQVNVVNIDIDTMTSEGDIIFRGINRNNSGEANINKLVVKKGLSFQESSITIRNELTTDISEGSKFIIGNSSEAADRGILQIGPHRDTGARAVATVKIEMALLGGFIRDNNNPKLIIAERATFNLFNNMTNLLGEGEIQVFNEAILQSRKTDPDTKISSGETGAILKTAGLVEGISFDNVQLHTIGDGQVIAGYLTDGAILEEDAKTIIFDLTQDYELSEKTISPQREDPAGFFNILYYKGKITFNQDNGEGDKVFPTGGFVDAAQGRFYAGDDNPGFTKSWFREFEDGEDPISLTVLPPGVVIGGG